jgi:nucleoid-associated protein YgaU
MMASSNTGNRPSETGNPSASTSKQQSATTGQWPKTYVVKAGDTLEGIAKSMYGPNEGLKRANIMRIFEANRGILESPQILRIGQQLTIPEPISKSAKHGGASTTVSASSASSSTTKGPERWYTVREGDSLWKIAAAELGKGNRYVEIVQLNQDILKGREDLQVGMRLRLPAK